MIKGRKEIKSLPVLRETFIPSLSPSVFGKAEGKLIYDSEGCCFPPLAAMRGFSYLTGGGRRGNNVIREGRILPSGYEIIFG